MYTHRQSQSPKSPPPKIKQHLEQRWEQWAAFDYYHL